MGAALAAWGPGALQRVQALARGAPAQRASRSSTSGSRCSGPVATRRRSPRGAAAVAARARLGVGGAARPPSCTRTSPPGLPFFVPDLRRAARDRAAAARCSRQYAALERAARRPDAHAKILWGDRAAAARAVPCRRSAQFAAAARLAPNDPEALTAAAVGRFTKDEPVRAFSRLGPAVQAVPAVGDGALPPRPAADLDRRPRGREEAARARGGGRRHDLRSRKEANDLLARLEIEH